MEKFGIFDLINKLSTQFDAPKKESPNQTATPKPATINKPAKKSNAYKSTVALIKRHEEISKRIDKNNR